MTDQNPKKTLLSSLKERLDNLTESYPVTLWIVAALKWVVLAFIADAVFALTSTSSFDFNGILDHLHAWFSSPGAGLFALAVLAAAWVDALLVPHEVVRTWVKFALLFALIVLPPTFRDVLDGSADPYLSSSLRLVFVALGIAAFTPYYKAKAS